MNIIFAVSGCSKSVTARLFQALNQLDGTPTEIFATNDRSIVVGYNQTGAAGIVATSTSDSGVVAYGCSARAGSSLADVLGSSSTAYTLLDETDDDLVAIFGDSSGITIAAGQGNHRLFIARFDGGTIVASHLGLLARSIEGVCIDRSVETFTLGYGFVPGQATIYKGISWLPPGIRLNLSTGTQIPIKSIPHEVSPATSNRSQAVSTLHDLILDATTSKVGRSDRVAVLLGGLDSALVAALLRRQGLEVHTFTFGFKDQKYEQQHAQSFSKRIGAIHHTVPITPEIIMKGLQGFADLSHQPGSQPHYQIHTIHASSVISNAGFDHVFTGDGCDSVFLGYPTVSRRAALTKRFGSLPNPLAQIGISLLSSPFVEHKLGHVARIGRNTLNNALLPMPESGHLPTRYLDDVALSRIREDLPSQHYSVDEIRTELASAVKHLDPIRLAYHGNGLNGQSKAKVDGALSLTGVTHSTPFLDPKLRNFVSALPTDFLRSAHDSAASSGKAILIEMIKKYHLLPDVIVDQPKQSPSDSPVDIWYSGALRNEVLDLLSNLPFPVNQTGINSLLRHKWAEDWYRERVSLSHHALQSIGLLCTYASFSQVTKHKHCD